MNNKQKIYSLQTAFEVCYHLVKEGVNSAYHSYEEVDEGVEIISCKDDNAFITKVLQAISHATVVGHCVITPNDKGYFLIIPVLADRGLVVPVKHSDINDVFGKKLSENNTEGGRYRSINLEVKNAMEALSHLIENDIQVIDGGSQIIT